jgi:hypothetical protein
MKAQAIVEKYCDTLFITHGDYILQCLTYKEADSVLTTERNLFKPIVNRQVFNFFKNGKLIKENVVLPIREVEVKTEKGFQKNIPEVVIFCILLCEIDGSDILYFHFQGYGGCNHCAGINAVFSLQGDLEYIKYNSDYELFLKKGEDVFFQKFHNKNPFFKVIREIYLY